ncbi:MAG: hypothetical protein ABSC95_05310 [Acetobacteraceae bacterium]
MDGGRHPFARDQTGFREWLRKGIAEGRDALLADFVKMSGPISAAYAARLRAADLEAYSAAAHDRVGMEDMPGTMTMPCRVYAGESDPIFPLAKSASERIPTARCFALPAPTHLQDFAESDRVLSRVMVFPDSAR